MLLIFKFALKQFLTLQSLPVRLHIGFVHIEKKMCAYLEIVLDIYLFYWQGAYFAWKATAMGKNYVNGKTFLEKR